MDIDQDAIAHDLALGRGDESHATHVSSQLVHFVKRTLRQGQSCLAILLLPEIQQQEFIGLGLGKFVLLDVHAAHPVSLSLELFHQVAADESSCTTYKSLFHVFTFPRLMFGIVIVGRCHAGQ